MKEDVVRPIFAKSSSAIVSALDETGPEVSLLDGLVDAFLSEMDGSTMTTELRTFLGLMLTTPAYKMRWLEVDPPLRMAVVGLLARHLDLNSDPYLHLLAADLIVHAARDAYQHWVTSQERKPPKTYFTGVSASCWPVSNMPWRQGRRRFRLAVGSTLVRCGQVVHACKNIQLIAIVIC